MKKTSVSNNNPSSSSNNVIHLDKPNLSKKIQKNSNLCAFKPTHLKFFILSKNQLQKKYQNRMNRLENLQKNTLKKVFIPHLFVKNQNLIENNNLS